MGVVQRWGKGRKLKATPVDARIAGIDSGESLCPNVCSVRPVV